MDLAPLDHVAGSAAGQIAGRIWVLPSALADQIAAGEVVERPASVVKELAENSLDAGARRIEIDVEGGGKKLIRVVDDGGGMSADEARLALTRHATSKLRALDDLFAMTTMGFRGEALPSIAAVSRLTLTTRTADTDVATRLEVHGGNALLPQPQGAQVGTTIEVRDLLANVPARLKFLKAETTEAAHITEAVSRLALAAPEVHFKLRHGGRVALDLPPHSTPGERVHAVLGRRLGSRLAEGAHEESGVRVRLWLLPPDEAQTTSRGLYLYVGRRFVRDRGLLQAVCMGHGELIPRGRYAQAVIQVEVAEGAVDINVHPQKTEVRFARPQEVFAAVRHAVAGLLARSPMLAEAPGLAPRSVLNVASSIPPSPLRVSELAARYGSAQERSLFGDLRPQSFSRPAATPPPISAASRGGFFASLTYLGQLDLTYLVCEGDGELVLIDQHAAHERVAFGRLMDARTSPQQQKRLFPERLALDPGEAAAALANADALAALGFDLRRVDEASHDLHAAPADLPPAEVEATLRELLAELGEAEASRALAERLELALATIACHSVVRAGDALSVDEARALLGTMDGVDFSVHCPHGRPVLLRIGVAELARRFGR
jgi:DNA mismatch repair protein MutL